MQDEADVADGEASDLGDFLVGTVVLKFEFEDLLLVGGESLNEVPDAVGKVMDIGLMSGLLLLGGDEGKGDFIAEIHALLLAQDVERAVAADGVEPGFDVFLNLRVVGNPELEEGILHHVTSSFSIPVEDAGGVADESAFMVMERTLDQLVGFGGITLV